MLKGLIPLNVGVTGHRDVVAEDRDAIEIHVRSFFNDLRRRYPNTPVRVYSGLAVGTDQFVAEIVLDMGIELIAIVPAPTEIYLEEFVTEAEIGEFHSLVERSTKTLEIPVVGEIPADAFLHERYRKRQHVALGHFLCDRSQILLALWDGTDNRLDGGTAWVVNQKLEGGERGGAERIDLPESGTVFHIPIRRQSTEAEAEPPSDPPSYLLHPGEHLEGYLAAFEEIESYNARLIRRAGHTTESQAKAPSAESQTLAEVYATADGIAMHYQRAVLINRRVMLSCALVMFVSYLVYSNFSDSFPVILTYFVALAAGAAVWLRMSRERLYKNYLDCRALAEALRVQEAWSSCGLRLSAVDYYLRKHHNELRWIRMALRCFSSDEDLLAAERERKPSEPSRPLGPIVADAIKAAWIEPQISYFRRAETKRRNKRALVERSATTLYGCGLACAAASLVISRGPLEETTLGHTLIILMGGLPGLAGIMLGYANNAGWEEEANEFAHMYSVFARAELLWDTVPHDVLLAEIGKEALRNNGEWLSVHSARRIEAPKL